jgi:hypothetical protein
MWATAVCETLFIGIFLLFSSPGFLLMLWITASAKALPDPSSKNELTSSKNIVGVASQIITNALLQVRIASHTGVVGGLTSLG